MNSVFERLYAMASTMVGDAAMKTSDMLPEVLLAILVLFIGWIIAVLVHHLVIWVLQFFAIDKLAAKTPLDGLLKSVGIRRSISDILAWLVFWLVILFTLITAADTLHLPQVSAALAIITLYIPQVIAALLIVIFGMLLAKFLQMVAVQTLSKFDIGYKHHIGSAVQFVVLLFVFVAAADQIGIELAYMINGIVTFFSVFLLLLGIGAAIGARTVLDNIIACQQVRRQLPAGSQVEIDGVAGTVADYTLTSVIVDTGEHDKVFPATHFLTHTYTKRDT